MNENTLIDILKANRLMLSTEEVDAFEKALAELAKNPNGEYLPELYLLLNDKCQHEEVMFSLIHFLESFDLKEQLQAFIDVVPNLVISAPEWTKIIHSRILNNESACIMYQDMLKSADYARGNVGNKLLAEITQERQPVNT